MIKEQRWSPGHKARDQGQGYKKSETLAKDSPSEDRPPQGQGQKCLRPRTQTQVFSKKKVFKTFFQAIDKILTIQKTVLSSNRGQGNFRGLYASRPRRCRRSKGPCLPLTTRRVAKNLQWGGYVWGSGGGAPSARKFCIVLQK